jgi:uncharacterized cupin superfamily protein
VNLTRLAPGGESALLHRHSLQDEFIYVLEGEPTLVTDLEEVQLSPGMCAGVSRAGDRPPAGEPDRPDAVYLEIGDRTPGDEGTYPRDDLKASLGPDGTWIYTHKDGRAY